ncbi:DUF378 domain-containing protein [Derxia gummosa]|uniref:DUF378 domain-containing protein n=1 Tax=Derxia gummosa DSM 723 TaxID=1121388 RepID=A0A8B6XAS1_9BURK|nr:DUF378 domain-containing protein [Derxia gummosa]
MADIHIPQHPLANAHVAVSGSKPVNTIDAVALVLLIVGGLNWGLVGTMGFDLVATLFGDMTPLSRIVYGLVGLSALWSIGTLGRLRRLPD